MLLKQPTNPCYLYQQYRSDETMLSFFSLLDNFKTLNYNYNPNLSQEANNLQANFYNLSKYSFFFLQCIYGFNYNIISKNLNQHYYDSQNQYDKGVTYDSNPQPLKSLFFSKALYHRKPKANRVFTIADFIRLLINAINANSQDSVSYNNFKIKFVYPSQNDTQTQWQITISGINLDIFNLIVSYLIYNKNHLPFGFNYKLYVNQKEPNG